MKTATGSMPTADGDMLALVDDLARLFARLYREGMLDQRGKTSDSSAVCQKSSRSLHQQ
jgi:hypothetical protein